MVVRGSWMVDGGSWIVVRGSWFVEKKKGSEEKSPLPLIRFGNLKKFIRSDRGLPLASQALSSYF